MLKMKSYKVMINNDLDLLIGKDLCSPPLSQSLKGVPLKIKSGSPYESVPGVDTPDQNNLNLKTNQLKKMISNNVHILISYLGIQLKKQNLFLLPLGQGANKKRWFKTAIYSLLILVSIGFSSCVKDLTELNKDPNNSTEINPDLQFKYAVKRGMSGYLTSHHFKYNGLHQWVQYFATRGGVEPGNLYLSPSGGDSYWNESYVDAMNNANMIQKWATEGDGRQAKAAAAGIWKIYLMQTVTDLWGDVPFNDAFKGNPDLNFTPEYDLQEEIYISLNSQLKLFSETLANNSADEFFDEESDLLFAGDRNAWIRFANSLRMRVAIRMSAVKPDLASSIFQDLQSVVLIENWEQSAAFQFNSVFNKPLYEASVLRYQEGAAYINPSKFLVDLLLNSEDPRIDYILEKTSLSATFPFLDEYRGVPNLVPYTSDIWDHYNLDAQLGDPLGEWGDVSRVGNWFMNNERPMPLLTYSEVCFLKAEAALLGWWNEDAEELVREGVRTHMQYMNEWADEIEITDSEILNYLNQLGEINFETIQTQKYILLVYENVIEAYAEQRRTGYPTLLNYEEEPIDLDIFPYRLRYPYSEYTYNRVNYLNAVERQGADNQLTKLWWNQ